MSKKQNKKPAGYAFALANGGMEYADDDVMAAVLRDTYEDLIVAEKTFKTEEDMEAFKKVQAATTPTKKKGKAKKPAAASSPDDEEELDDNQKKEWEQMKAMIENNRPSTKLEFHYKVAAASPIAVVIVRFKGEDGKDDWRMKPAALLTACSSYYSKIKAEDKDVQAFVMSLDLCDQRDLSGPSDKVLVNHWTSPTTQKRMAFPFSILAGRVMIPYADLGTYEAEADYLDSKLRSIGSHLKDVMATKMFGLCCQHAINQESIWAAIGDPNKTRNYYKEFVTSCKVKVEKCGRLAAHVVTDDASRLLEEMFEKRLKDLKHPGQQVRPHKWQAGSCHYQLKLTSFLSSPRLPPKLPSVSLTPMGLMRTRMLPKKPPRTTIASTSVNKNRRKALRTRATRRKKKNMTKLLPAPRASALPTRNAFKRPSQTPSCLV